MNEQQTLGIQFVLRQRKERKQGSVYIRITVDGDRCEFSSHLQLDKKVWDKQIGIMKGKTAIALHNNRMLDQIKGKLIGIYQDLRIREEFIDAKTIRDRYLGNNEKKNTLLKLIDFHYESQKHTLSESTLKYYKTTKRYLIAFLQTKKKTQDIYLRQIDYKFITEYEAFLRSYQPPSQSKRKLAHNTVMKLMSRFRTLINFAIKLEWMEHYPFRAYKLSYKQSTRTFLDARELKTIELKQFSFERLQLAKDLFIFSCYTGLSFIDIVELEQEAIVKGIDGGQWIKMNRHKTDNLLQIPLLPEAALIVEKYNNHPISEYRGRIFPVPTNQKVNAYLKEIADICRIKKKLTFHMARHTFATTVTLSNGVPIETVSKILGHNKISTTQIYAKVVENKISEDMGMLRSKLSRNKENNNSNVAL